MYKKYVGIVLSLLLIITGQCYAAHKRPSAGILPYCIDNAGQAHFLLGQEPNGVWADFGGRADPTDRDPKETAMREFTEETRCVFGMYDYKQNRKLRKKILHYPECMRASQRYIKPRMSQGLRHPRGYYVMYVARVDYIPAEVFNRAAKIPHYEKKRYAWVPADALISVVETSGDRHNTRFEGKKIRAPFCDMLKTHAPTLRRLLHSRRRAVVLQSDFGLHTHAVR